MGHGFHGKLYNLMGRVIELVGCPFGLQKIGHLLFDVICYDETWGYPICKDTRCYRTCKDLDETTWNPVTTCLDRSSAEV